MPNLPHLSGKEIVRALEQLGFVQARQRGSHVVMKKTTADGEVAIGTLNSILKQAKISPDEFIKVEK